MHVKLGLSNEQVSMLKKQQETTHAQIKAVKENKTLSSDEKKHQVRLLKENFKETRKNILTPEQLKKLDDMKRGKRNMESNKARK